MLNKSEEKLFQRGFLLHAVAVLAPQGAILLLGHSGAGKTTLGRLLNEYYPIIADDIVFVAQHKIDKQWYIADAKSSRPDDRYNFFPLSLAIRTFQSPVAQINRISERELCRYLLDAAYEAGGRWNPTTDAQKNWFADVALIARSYQGWKLLSTISPETPELVRKLFSKNNFP
jgi:energy-coupling factor transporter ATP-binding protein EcfA2